MATARHPKTAIFVQRSFFSGLTLFAELERRIAALPEEKARGDAFEVFAEAYLATQRKHDAAQVWPHGSEPLDLLKNLGLTQSDQGVDGVLQTLLGEFDAYQVKFRTGRPALTWRELSTFIGLADSPRIHSRVLLTNCDELPAVLNDRQGFFCIRGADLDRMEAADFRAIEAWLADSAYTAPKKTPQPHQAEALEALLPALQTNDRVSAIMACGTGKTLVALWVTEHVARASSPAGSSGVPAARILVLLPSLALLRQTLHEWLRETSLPNLAYLCVCSDPTVKEGVDALATPQSDLDFQVSTSAASVRRFLDVPFVGSKLIFSTYQSASVVGAAMLPGESFDLAVFDEAHKTAGREGRNFAFALDDNKLAVRKRLFLTATPRHYNPHDRDREGEARLLFSMDNPAVYGPQAYRLTFAEAARRGIICGYKVIISVITSDMVTNELLSHGEVFVNGDAVRARQVANQIALRDAIEKYGVKKVFTFHRDVKSAQSFVSDGPEGIGTHLADVAADARMLHLNSPPDAKTENQNHSLVTSAATAKFQTCHVNGSMPTAHRERALRDFRAAARAIVSNARCLTEGVDVPAVDMVAFLSPRRSRVDIVQATGRAMRRSPGKTTGYVLVPLYVELTAGETVEAAVKRAQFDEVWDVLYSVQEQDEILSELIRYVGEQKGRGKGFDGSRFAERIDFGGPRLGLEHLRAALTTRCLESLCSSWDTWFGKLKAFRERFGHCNVETNWEEDPALASWVSGQRTRWSKGLLFPKRIRLLEDLGFVWGFQTIKGQETWLKRYHELVNYTQEHGNPHVPRTHANKKLASWVWIQRGRRGTSCGSQPPLTTEQIALLNKLRFRWDVHEEKWSEHFERLKNFKEKHGHCQVGLVENEDDDLLGWIGTQRSMLAHGKLEFERKRKLDSIGFSWTGEITDRRWDTMYARLKAYRTTHGDSNVPCQWKEDRKLADWVINQRRRRIHGLITDGQVRLLDELGFAWKQRDVGTWEDRLAEVVAFKARHGHCNIPPNFQENPKLSRFVNNMRSQRNSGNLAAERIAKLDAIGFMWRVSRVAAVVGETTMKAQDTWGERYSQLAAFKEKHGHCDVPFKWSKNPQLGGWVSRQRRFKKSGDLPPDREERLNEIGFRWQEVERGDWELWESRFQELIAFKAKHSHCNIPVKWKENIKLGMWSAAQRALRKSGKLKRERERRLNEIGFDWREGSTKAEWKSRFDQLKDYRRRFGHCCVPVRWQENPQLGAWVARQRNFRKASKMAVYKERLLTEIGFVWAQRQTTSSLTRTFGSTPPTRSAFP